MNVKTLIFNFLFQLLLVVVFNYSNYSTAQTINLNQFGIEEGLPQSSIYTMQQDKDGSIWVGTMNGVSKYNGLSFENFNKKNGLAENRVTASCIDKNGDIWFGHWSGGLTKYNITNKQFTKIIPKNINLSKLISSIFLDSRGVIWIGTNGQGLVKYENNTFTQLTTKNGLTSNMITSFVQPKDGSLWVGTANGITLIDKEIHAFNININSKYITSLLNDKKGNTWVGTSDKGVFRIDNTGKLIAYSTQQGLANNYVKTIFETDAGVIFIGTYGGGVSKYQSQLEDNKYDGPLFQTISSKHGLSNDRVLSIIEDREKNIWIGTLLNLNQYFDEQFEIFGENEGLENSLVWSIIQDKRGTFWIGTEQGLVQFIPESYGKESNQKLIYSINKNQKEDDSNQSNRYHFIRKSGQEGQIVNTTALYEDINGNIWFTDFGRGLSMINPLNGEIKTYTTENGLSVNEVYCINGDKKGNIWIGTNNGGLLKYNLKTQKFKKYTTANGIGSNQIYTMYCDSKNRLWLGSLTGNLTMFNLENGANDDEYNFINFSEKEGYSSKFTISITEDMEGDMWFGTYDMGLYKYDGKKFKSYTTKDGIISNTPFLLVCDNHNNLWIGTGLGIDKFNLKEETFKHYEKEDGFLGIEINPNAVCKDDEGNLWFGSIIGLVKYKSKFERTNLMESITTIEDPRVFFQKIKIPKDHEFSWNENHLTFDFIGNSLTNPKRVKYRYKLEGVDNDWSPIVKDNSVTYPSVQPGTYTFKVRSCNNDGVWNKIPATFKFKITPPFWKTIWFYVICAILLVGSFYLFMKYKERKLRAENILLEEKVVERTEEVVKQKKEIERKNTIITDSLEYAKDIQYALLPATDEMNKIFHNHFVLFKPKDIVSGDFYWLYEDSERKLIGVADCTGHGVPGAFVSLLGYNLLNEIVSENKNLTPAQILENLNSRILEALKQNDEYTSAKYGMDISLVSISKNLQKLQFAGAHNSLFVFRDNEVFELKANKFSIGSSRRIKEMEFTDQSFDIQKGDMIYMFTDGYKDQIGGPENKRFFAKPFRILLQEISTLEITEQRNKLDETIIAWSDNKSQTDDILIIGIRI